MCGKWTFFSSCSLHKRWCRSSCVVILESLGEKHVWEQCPGREIHRQRRDLGDVIWAPDQADPKDGRALSLWVSWANKSHTYLSHLEFGLGFHLLAAESQTDGLISLDNLVNNISPSLEYNRYAMEGRERSSNFQVWVSLAGLRGDTGMTKSPNTLVKEKLQKEEWKRQRETETETDRKKEMSFTEKESELEEKSSYAFPFCFAAWIAWACS